MEYAFVVMYIDTRQTLVVGVFDDEISAEKCARQSRLLTGGKGIFVGRTLRNK